MFGIYREGNSDLTLYVCKEEVTELKDQGKRGVMFTQRREDIIVPSPLFVSRWDEPHRRLSVFKYMCVDSLLLTDTTLSIPLNPTIGYHVFVPNGLFDRLRRERVITRKVTRMDFRSDPEKRVHINLVNSALDLFDVVERELGYKSNHK